MDKTPQALRHDLCIGCGYCASFPGVAMKPTVNGFQEPARVQDEYSGVEAALIAAACPGLNGAEVTTPDAAATDPYQDRMWGNYHSCLTGFSTDPVLRHNGSSGGVVSALAAWLVETGRVDGVVTTFYDPAFPIGTESHLSVTGADAAASAGSKYSPAAPLAALAEIRDREGTFAVVGKPCDIATLRRAMAAGDPAGEKIAYLLSFFCAGTPSDRGNREVLEYLGAPAPEELDSFRHRGDGWPGSTRAVLRDGGERTCTYNESWGKILRRHTHNLCTICPDGIGELADIVAADAWYGDDDGYPQFEEADGRSLILTRTSKGEALLREAVAEKALEIEPLPVREIDRMQPGQLKRRQQLKLRAAVYHLLGRKTPTYNRQALIAYQAGLGAKEKLSIFFGTLRRMLRLLARQKRANSG